MDHPAQNSNLPVQDERVLAALGHISALLPMIGVLAPIVIWVTQREKSRYVSFQALQAIAFQLLIVLIYIAGFACYMGSFFLVFIGGIATNRMNSMPGPGFMFLFPFVILFGMLALMLTMVIYGIVGAVLTFQGRDFHYALVGRWVEKYAARQA